MRRQEWFELHDHRLYPGFLRDLVTDALEAIWNCTNSYRVIVPRLRAAMEDAETHHPGVLEKITDEAIAVCPDASEIGRASCRERV